MVAKLDDVDAAFERGVQEAAEGVRVGAAFADELEPRGGELVEAGGHGLGSVGDGGATIGPSTGAERERLRGWLAPPTVRT